MFISLLYTIYPFLSKYLKYSFAKPGSEKYYIDLIYQAIQYREENKIERLDYLDYLINLKRRKEISGRLIFVLLSLIN